MSESHFIKPDVKYSKKEQDIIKSSNRFIFDIKNIDLAVINSIRRVIISEVPTLGFLGEDDSTIKITKNNGPLHNEFMIHRISNIPIHFNEDDTESFTENEYEFYLSKSNLDSAILNVTTKDIRGKKNNKELTDKELNRLFPANSVTKEHILITRLRQNEELEFTGNIIKANTLTHASFSPVSLCSFSFIQDENKNKDEKDILQKERNYIKNEYGDPTSIRFSIEPEKGLSSKYLVSKAIEILKDKNDFVGRELDVSVSEKIKLVKNDDIDNTYDLHVNFETDTYGNLFQSLNFNKYIRDKETILDGKYNVSYIGYYAPHPFDAKIIIRISVTNKNNITPTREEFINIFKKCISNVSRSLDNTYDEWIRFE